MILGNGFLVIAQNVEAVETKFAVSALGPWIGRQRSSGETVEFCRSDGVLVDEVTYGLGFPGPTVGDDPRPSLQLIRFEVDNDLAGSWRAAEPTPATPNEAVLVENPRPIYGNRLKHQSFRARAKPRPSQSTSDGLVQCQRLPRFCYM